MYCRNAAEVAKRERAVRLDRCIERYRVHSPDGLGGNTGGVKTGIAAATYSQNYIVPTTLVSSSTDRCRTFGFKKAQDNKSLRHMVEG